MVICLFLKFLFHLTALLHQTVRSTGLHSCRELFKSEFQIPTEKTATLTLGFFNELPRFIQTKARTVPYYRARIFNSILLILRCVKVTQFTLYKLGTWWVRRYINYESYYRPFPLGNDCTLYTCVTSPTLFSVPFQRLSYYIPNNNCGSVKNTKIIIM
jgi:hypothetical protein